SPVTATLPSAVPCRLPRRIVWVRVSIASPHVRPSPNDRRVGIRIRTFEACSGFTLLRPIGLLSSPRPPLSQGSDPASYPAVSPASFRTNRQLSGCDPPSLIVRALGARGQSRRSGRVYTASRLPIYAERFWT